MNHRKKIEEYGKRIVRLERRLELSRKTKESIIARVSRMNILYRLGLMSLEEKTKQLDRMFGAQSYDGWIDYYEKDIKNVSELVSGLRAEIRQLEEKETRQYSQKEYLAIFMILAVVFGFLAFAGMPEGTLKGFAKGLLEPKASITGNVVMTGATTGSVLDFPPNQRIDSLFTFTFTIQTTGDNVGNETWMNATLLRNSSMMSLKNFILNSSGWNCYNYSYGPLVDVDNIRNWEGKTGYGFGRNRTGPPGANCEPTSDYTVNLTSFFPAVGPIVGLYAPSVLGTYNVTLNGTYNRTVAGVTRVNPEIVVWLNIEFNVTERGKPTMNVSAPLNNTYNNSEEIVFEYTPWDNFSLKNCSILFDNALNTTNYTITNFTKNTFNFSSMTDAVYNWRINCTDSSPNYNVNGTEQYVVYMDRTPPTITPIVPGNNTMTTNTFMNFTWNSTDKISFGQQCNLTINGTVQNALPLNGSNISMMNITISSLALGSYLWNITCWDNATNTNITEMMLFNVTEPVNAAPPDTIIVGIMDDETDECGNNAYDKTTNTTHMTYIFGPTLNWTEGTDEDGNAIKTRICIGATMDVYLVDLHGEAAGNASTICNVLNAWQNTSAIAGQWINLTNSTFVANSTINSTAAATNYTYYAMFMPQDDGTPVRNGNSTNYTISVINNAPISSTTFVAASTTAALTHSNTTSEVYKWTLATDADDGSGADKCPADTLTHNATIGTSFGDVTYFGDAVADPAGAGFSLASGIPYNASINTVDNTTNSTIYASFGACDNYGLCADRTNTTFYLYNNVPNTPTVFNISSTHDQTPMVGWTNSTDLDGDNITYYVLASLVEPSKNDLLSLKKTAKQGDSNFWDQVIAWGTDNLTEGYANDTIYIIVWAQDNLSTANNTGFLNTTFRLTDYLPDVTGVSMTDSAGYAPCGSTCSLTPKSGSNATNIAIQINMTDLDRDCTLDGNATANIYLCAYQTGVCDEQKYNFTWLFEAARNSTDSTKCWLNWSVNLTATNNTPQFWLPNASLNEPYKLWVNVTSSSGRWRTGVADNEANTTWQYALLSSINFTTAVTLGGTTNEMDTWNNGSIGYLMTNFGNNILNVTWNASDSTYAADPGDTLTINGTNLEIDDDNKHIIGETTGMIAVNLTRPALTDFFPSDTGLERCIADACDNSLENETTVLYWHIAPTSLIAGDYRSNITYYITTFTP